ncbi:hypothetical protein FB45DRAFT_162806 [Roridomyces roridus]|uniref:Uncharacterized protein n=1 Tax=Roridomyces roridus TaxID=1738132 RepID=A0AAD7BFV8_9AGAR|nr:hypothetical protein FB45DRAFT_162806 [Roridomyces roridus]
MSLALLVLLPLTLLFSVARADLANLTIDDTNTTYWVWLNSWTAITPTLPCPGCAAQPDSTSVYNRTWHDGTLVSGIFNFQGTAVYIYGIDIPKQFAANIQFNLFSNWSVAGLHTYSGSEYVYDSLFFSATNLNSSVPDGVHWTIKTSEVGQAALFDYAKVTVDDANSTDVGSEPPTGQSSGNSGTTGSYISSSFFVPTN